MSEQQEREPTRGPRLVPRHECTSCTCATDDHEPGTVLLDAANVVWFKSWADEFPWGEVYGRLRPAGGGYRYMGNRGPKQPVVVLGVVDREAIEDPVTARPDVGSVARVGASDRPFDLSMEVTRDQ